MSAKASTGADVLDFTEGTQFFEDGPWPTPGVYEILLLESGNIKFELIEDVCTQCTQSYVGAFSTEGKIEWERVP